MQIAPSTPRADDPGLLQVLSIVMRGVAGIGAQAEEEAREEEDDRALDAGDSEDGDAQPGEDEDTDQADDQSHLSSSSKQNFTIEQINRRRKGLVKAMDAFQELLTRLAAEPSLVSNRLAAQTAFMIQLMMLACTFNHMRQDGASVRLMVLYPMHDSERDFSFALRVARMLKTIWVQDFLVEDHPISRVGDHLNGSLAEPKATSLTRPFSCWQVFVP